MVARKRERIGLEAFRFILVKIVDIDHPKPADAPLRLAPGAGVADGAVRTGPRVGVTRAPDVAWRWWVAEDPAVSAYRRSPRAAPPA